MSKHILQELHELRQAQVITEDEANRIRQYYENKPNPSTNRLFIVFGILGALLVGMGIVLIVAHNWDTLPKAAKLAIGLLPMLAGQCLAGYLIFKGGERTAWREGCGTFLCFAVALSISIVAQVYNIEGNFGRFLLTWMVLTLPIVYVLRSSMTALLFIAGITWYACEVGYFSYSYNSDSVVKAWPYWMLLLAIIPYYYSTFLRSHNKSNFFYFHSWLLVLSVTVCLGLFITDGPEELIVLAYMSLFSAFVIVGQLKRFETNRVLANAYLVVGSLGIVMLLMSLSFDWYWEEITRDDVAFVGTEFTAALAFTLIAGVLLVVLLQQKAAASVNTKSYAFLAMIGLFALGIASPVGAQLCTNLAILIFAVYTIRDGAQRDHLGILNYGLLIITALILCRFFDTDLSFVVRGILFIAVGVGFFVANYTMIKKRKKSV